MLGGPWLPGQTDNRSGIRAEGVMNGEQVSQGSVSGYGIRVKAPKQQEFGRGRVPVPL